MTASEVDVETGEEGEVGMEETEAVEEEEEEVILIWNVLVSPFDFFFLAFYMNLIRERCKKKKEGKKTNKC